MSEENKNIPTPEQEPSEQTVSVGENAESVSAPEPVAEAEAPAREPKKKGEKKIDRITVICVCVAVFLAAVMLTFTVCSFVYELKLRKVQIGMPSGGVGTNNSGAVINETVNELDLLRQLFEYYSFCELDGEALRTAVLKAYVEATGDKYAQYYTDEEYEEFTKTLAGDTQGIGINIMESYVNIDGIDYKVLKIVNVIKDSPAAAAGINKGDLVYAVGTIAQFETITELGFDKGFARLKGEIGTNADFIVLRPSGDDYEVKEYSIPRSKIEAEFVMSESVTDPTDGSKIGIILITRFYYSTPTQMCEAIEKLRAEGCTKFVFDVRNNIGGEVSSIMATLSYFLNEGDTVMSVVDKMGNSEVMKVAPVSRYEGEKAPCNVRQEDIGKYRDLDVVVLCNEYTASAAEIFVANFRDYGIAKIVGSTTYGKGSVQRYLPLYHFGCEGVLKMTMEMYYPPCGQGYDGVGITPDVSVALSAEAWMKNFYDIFGDLSVDNQLAEAIKHFN
jgi:carboxyl-terminal processing protease